MFWPSWVVRWAVTPPSLIMCLPPNSQSTLHVLFLFLHRGACGILVPCLLANSLQSCPTLCEPMDCSPSGSSDQGLNLHPLQWKLEVLIAGSPGKFLECTCFCFSGVVGTLFYQRKPRILTGQWLWEEEGGQALIDSFHPSWCGYVSYRNHELPVWVIMGSCRKAWSASSLLLLWRFKTQHFHGAEFFQLHSF